MSLLILLRARTTATVDSTLVQDRGVFRRLFSRIFARMG